MHLQKLKYLPSIVDDSVITSEQIINAEETKTYLKHFKNLFQKTKFLYFTYLFINYHFIIHSC